MIIFNLFEVPEIEKFLVDVAVGMMSATV